MRKILTAVAAIALVAAHVPAFAQGQGQAKKSGAEAHGKAVAKGKTKENTASQRSNKGGETRGKARADEVQGINQNKKAGG